MAEQLTVQSGARVKIRSPWGVFFLALVTLGIDSFVCLSQVPIWINHEAGAIPVHRALVFTLANAGRTEQLVIGIRQEVYSETKLVAEVLVRRNIVFANADNGDVRIVEFLFSCRK